MFKKQSGGTDYSPVSAYQKVRSLSSVGNAVASFRYTAENLHKAGKAKYRAFIDEALGSNEVSSVFKDELRQQCMGDSLYKDYQQGFKND